MLLTWDHTRKFSSPWLNLHKHQLSRPGQVEPFNRFHAPSEFPSYGHQATEAEMGDKTSHSALSVHNVAVMCAWSWEVFLSPTRLSQLLPVPNPIDNRG